MTEMETWERKRKKLGKERERWWMFRACAKPSTETKSVLGMMVYERVGYFANIAFDFVFPANCLKNQQRERIISF